LLFSLGWIGTALPFSLITWGQLSVPSGLAAILNASTAIFSVLVAALLFRDERLSLRKLIGAGLGFAGVSLAIGWQSFASLDVTALGQLALIAASLCYALTGAVGKVALRGVVPQVAATGMLTGSALVMVPLALWAEGVPAAWPGLPVWTAMAYSAVMATALAYLIFYRMLALAGAGNAGLTTLLVAPVAIVLGAVLLAEALPLRAYLGFALLAAGLLVVDGRILRLWRPAGPKLGPAP
jgi:drug/metabolite transporter (DMT)-like permease